MKPKKDISPNRWTPFWKSLGIVVQKRKLFLERYNPKVSDINPLVKRGVDRAMAERVYSRLCRYRDPLVFHNFCTFFRRDPETILVWTNAATPTEAFERLYQRFARNSLEDLRRRFGELRLLFEYNQKGEGRRYQITYHRAGSVPNLSGSQFTRRLNRNDRQSRYVFQDAFTYDGATIVCILKRGTKDVYKFIKVRRQGSTIDVVISADSKAEYGLVRKALQQYFKSYVDSPQSTANWGPVRRFLRQGVSSHFRLVGVTYAHDDFQVSVRARHQQHTALSNFRAYSNYLQGNSPERVVTNFRVSNTHLSYRQPIAIDVMTSDNSSVVGAILLRPLDRRLNSNERETLSHDFKQDFGIRLGDFISYDDLTTKDVYRRLLQTVGRKSADFHLRSDHARDIFKNLVSRGLIEPDLVTQDEPHYCTNRQCRISYEIQRGGRKHCSNCGQHLLPGHSVMRAAVNEKQTARNIAGKIDEYGLSVDISEKKLLNRHLYIVSVARNRSAVEIIPVAGTLHDNQLELLHLRFPNALVLTSQDNLETYSSSGIEARRLFEFLHLVDHGTLQDVTDIFDEVVSGGLNRVRNSVRASARHYRGSAYYQSKNAEKRNLGAELFEAHTHLIWAYMFKNSTWLGAKRRGSPVPDGISALPVVRDKADGCILWDAKYSDGNINLGGLPKNNHYIASGKQNSTVRANGGVGGFVFVGSRPAPTNFSKAYRKLGGARKPKVVYMTNRQLLKLYNHFVANESDLSNNTLCYREFMNAIHKMLISTAGGTKAVALNDPDIDKLLAAAEAGYDTHRTPAVTA